MPCEDTVCPCKDDPLQQLPRGSECSQSGPDPRTWAGAAKGWSLPGGLNMAEPGLEGAASLLVLP